MAILGLLLLIGVVGAAVAVAWANQSAIDASTATLNVFGEQVSLNVGQLFLAGAATGALAMLALWMTIGGTRRRMSRTALRNRELRDRELELQSRLADANATRDERAAVRDDDVARQEREDAVSNR